MAFAAEATKIKEDDVYDPIKNECSLPKKNAAVGLAFASVLTLLTAQMIINAFNGCFCCKKHQRISSKRWAMALFTFIFSWVAFIIAFFILLLGAWLNNQQADYFETCAVIKPGAFSGAAVSALAAVCLGLISYVSLSFSKHVELQDQVIASATIPCS